MLLLLLTITCSWIGSLCGLPVQNLLSNEGVRWMLRHAMDGFSEMPVLSVMLLMMEWGVLSNSGWIESFVRLVTGGFRKMTPRQKWGMQVSILVLFAFLMLLAYGFLGEEPVLLSIKGELWQSPIWSGFPLLFLLCVILMSGTYAWLCGRFCKYTDFVASMVKGVADWCILLIILFLLGLQVGLLRYML